MKAILLAAGLGTRLKPVTEFIPKCMVPVNGIPLLVYWVQAFKNAGVDKVLVNLHYKAEWFEKVLPQFVDTDFVEFVYEEELLGTGGTVYKNREFIGEDDFIVVHADNLSAFNVNSFLEAFRKRPSAAEFTMMTFETPRPDQCGIVALDGETGLVTEFLEKVPNPPSNFANAAVYIFANKILGFLAGLNKSFIDISIEVIPEYVGRFNTFHNSSFHRDLGFFEDFLAVQSLYESDLRFKIPDSNWAQDVDADLFEKFVPLLAEKLELVVDGDSSQSARSKLYVEDQFSDNADYSFVCQGDFILFKNVPNGFSSKHFKTRFGVDSLGFCQRSAKA